MKVSCPKCGGNIKFIPEKQKFLCDYCGKLSNIKELKVDSYFDKEDNYSECVCSSCGSKLITDNNTLITICSYCGSTQILKEKYLGNFRPEKIIPFQYNENYFKSIFTSFLDMRNYIPDSFYNETVIKDIKGIYVPFVMYKVECDSYARGEGAEKKSSDDDTIRYYCKYFEMKYEMNGTITFDTSEKIEDKEMQEIGPFEFEKLEDFNPAYLNGFLSEYGNEEKIGEKLVNEILRESDDIIREMITNERYSSHIYNGGYNKIHLKVLDEIHVLLPVFMYNCNYKNKNYRFLINGQSGKIIGETPVDKKKVIKASIPAILFWGVILLLISLLIKNIDVFLIMLVPIIIIIVEINYNISVSKYTVNPYDNQNTFFNKMVKYYHEYPEKEYKNKFKKDYFQKHIQIINNGKLYYNKIDENQYKIDRKNE